MAVITHASVEGFFQEVLEGAMGRQGVQASESTEFYLVGLLGEYARARLPDEPLSLRLAETTGADAGERVRALKEVGDTSLYVAGFFAESLTRSLVDVDYYVGLGVSAYAQLAGRLGGNLTQVYGELAEHFPDFVDVLGEVRRRVDFASADVVKLYEQWLRTRDAWVEKKLRTFGVLIDPGSTKVQ
jgi:hypothetical protein